MTGRALSLHPPYAQEIIDGTKQSEFRSRPTKVRGRVWIYETKKNGGRGLVIGSVEIVQSVKRAQGGWAWRLKNPKPCDPVVPRGKPQPVFFDCGLSLEDDFDAFEQRQEQTAAQREVEDRLRHALRRCRKRYDELKKDRREIFELVRQEVREAVAAVEVSPVAAPPKRSGKGTPETAICCLADWQLGKRTPSYNSDVAAERVERFGRRVLSITEVQRADHPVRDCRVYLLGDLVEGELIFPGQSHRIDSSLYRQVFENGTTILANLLRTLLATFDQVHVEAVVGNHGSLGGRARKDYHPETNADAFLYEATRLMLLDQKRLTWGPNVIADERRWYAVDRVGNFGYMLFHGDQIKSSSSWGGIPFYGFYRAIQGWINGGIREPFDYSISGHYHQSFRLPMGPERTHFGAGSTESDNTWAMETLKSRSDPTQLLLFSHPTRGKTAEYEVPLLKD